MSDENVEVVRSMYTAFATRDRATILSNLDPAMRVYDRPHHPEASVYEGRAEYVVVPIRQAGKGKGSALGIEESIVNVWKLRGGKCVELRNYSTLDEALGEL